MSVTRYNFEVASQFKITDQIVYVEARPSKSGKYVRYSDCAALLARVARLEEFAKKAGLAFDDIGAVNWSRRARRVLEEK